MVEVFREVKRVLRDDGTLWLNLGDSYAGSWGDYVAKGKTKRNGTQAESRWERPGYESAGYHSRPPTATVPVNLKPKDLVGIPWRVAFALQADGWWLRSDIIWHKPNPMPESVRDRPTKAHEYLFLLAKSKRYYYDADAVREENSPTTGKWGKSVPSKTAQAQGNGKHGASGFMGGEIEHDETIARYYTQGRNRRSVWTVTTKPFRGAHFAVFPSDLIEPCIKAGSGTEEPHRIVLDPFMGAGTTALVALGLNRDYLGIELNQDYIDMAKERIAEVAGTQLALV